MAEVWLKHWPRGIPRSLTYPEISLPEILSATTKKYPENTALIFLGRRITYGELDQLCDSFASALIGLGVEKGDRVALLLPNVPQFPICYYGALRAGAIAVPCSPLYKARELQFQLTDSGAETVVALDSLCGQVAEVCGETQIRNIVTTGLMDFASPVEGTSTKEVDAFEAAGRFESVSLKELLAEHGEAPPKVSIDASKDPALLQYTGGTTGVPKAAVLTHRNLVANTFQFGSWLQVLREGGEVVLAALPYFHIFGMTVALNVPVLKGAGIVLQPRFDAGEALRAIERYGVTFFPGVPTMFIAVLNHPKAASSNLRSVRLCISGASPLPVEVMRRLEAATGGVVAEGYGLTEASPVTHCNPVDDMGKVRVGSIGLPIPDTEAKIVDVDDGETELAADEVGELVVRGPQVMAGYWNRPLDTEQTLRGGWLYTGDIAKRDEDGYFYIVDRKKDMINVSGLKVWPREVEAVLCEHPAVKEAGVIGVHDPYRGEAVKAFVVLREGFEGKISAAELMRFCEEKMAVFKVPSQVEFVEQLPRTAIGKLLRRTLKEKAARR